MKKSAFSVQFGGHTFLSLEFKNESSFIEWVSTLVRSITTL
jgi:hypothetical protein